jgi:hypothetical protein
MSRAPIAAAFSHAAQAALLANVGLIAVALILVLALPRQIPGCEPSSAAAPQP